MSTSHLTVSTGTARPYKPAVNQDAQDIANVVGDQVKQAIHQSLLDAASTADAKVRRSLQGQYPDEVLDAVAGPALAALAQSSQQVMRLLPTQQRTSWLLISPHCQRNKRNHGATPSSLAPFTTSDLCQPINYQSRNSKAVPRAAVAVAQQAASINARSCAMHFGMVIPMVRKAFGGQWWTWPRLAIRRP